MEVKEEIMVCEDCISIIANDDDSGIESRKEAARIRRAVRALGSHACLGDQDKTEEFSPNNCDCCGALPGKRFHVVILGEPEQETRGVTEHVNGPFRLKVYRTKHNVHFSLSNETDGKQEFPYIRAGKVENLTLAYWPAAVVEWASNLILSSGKGANNG